MASGARTFSTTRLRLRSRIVAGRIDQAFIERERTMTGKPRRRRRSALRFDIVVNGQRTCLAGSGRYGVLSLALTWIRRDPEKRPTSKKVEKWCQEECKLRIGALTDSYQESWPAVPLKCGDEIAIRLLGPGFSLLPPSRTCLTPRWPKTKRAGKPLSHDSGESATRWHDGQPREDSAT